MNRLKSSLIILGLAFTTAVFSAEKQAVNVNKVEAVALSKAVKGIGPKRAEAVVAFRKEHGRFNTIDDLTKVRGIGKKFIEKYRDYLKTVLKFDD